MTYQTNADVIREVRKTGKIYAAINTEHDTIYLPLEKKDLLLELSRRDTKEPCNWYVGILSDGTRAIHTQEEPWQGWGS